MEAITHLRKLPPKAIALFASAIVPPILAIAVGAASSDFRLWRLLGPTLIVGGVLTFIAWQFAKTQEPRRSRQRFPGAPDSAPGTPPQGSRRPQTLVSASAARGHAQRCIKGSSNTHHHYSQAAAHRSFFWWSWHPLLYILKGLSYLGTAQNLRPVRARIRKDRLLRKGARLEVDAPRDVPTATEAAASGTSGNASGSVVPAVEAALSVEKLPNATGR